MDAPKMLLIVMAMFLLAFLGGDLLHVSLKSGDVKKGIRNTGNSVVQQSIQEGYLRTQKKIRLDEKEVKDNLPFWIKENLGDQTVEEAEIHYLSEDPPVLALKINKPVESRSQKFIDEPFVIDVKGRTVVIWDSKK